jgi:hypothetical protein
MPPMMRSGNKENS